MPDQLENFPQIIEKRKLDEHYEVTLMDNSTVVLTAAYFDHFLHIEKMI